MLTISHLSKKYANRGNVFSKNEVKYKKALNDISLELGPGLYGLLGPNGAGKSTLINIVTGSLKQSSGTVKWNDVSIKKLGKKYRKILGFMPQQQTLYDSFTGKQFLQYMCALKELPKETTRSEVDRVAEKVNLTENLNKRLSAFSGGMKQRLLAASAILGKPELLIFDEPTAGLDPKERVRLRSLLKELSESAVVLVATHVVSDVETVADDIILLKDGNIVDMDTVPNLIDRYAPGEDLEKVYLNIFDEEGIF